jgi:hypothetical protein
MKPQAAEIISKLAERRAAKGLPQLEAADAVWITHAFVSIFAPVSLPGATPEELAMWFAECLPEIENFLSKGR